jgi:hypothetical protein
MYVVCKPFAIGERQLRSGELVDAREWRNVRQLVTQRYLRPATAAERKAK